MTYSRLPEPTRNRWQPLRIGLVDLFLYDHVEFRFRDGHLLLRGNNGTGKSKVLALSLPFLLDGQLSAARVEPDGDPGKRMEWNLLMGGRYDERLGYTWLEFGRRDESGAAAFVTLGCGLKAVAGRGIADHWFFVTSGRVGEDFSLVGPTGVVHSRERLGEAIEGFGHVYRRAEEYRRAIDERLFHLGPDRYEALINLLIQLRQPQLSRRPDEEKLSRALSEALRPVDQAILNVVAEAFHDLEQQREELRGLHETHAELERFVGGYRRYAAAAARRLAHEVRSTHAAYQAIQRDLVDVRRELEEATAADQAAAERRAKVAGELATTRGLVAELRDRREVRELEAAERLAQLAQEQADQATALSAEADGELDRRRAALEAINQAVADAERALHEVLAEADRLADAVGLPGLAGELALRLRADAEHPADETLIRAAEAGVETSVSRRREAVRHLRDLIAQLDAANQRLEAARAQLHEFMGLRDAASDRLAAALQRTQTVADALVERWRGYLRSLVELQLPDSEQVLAELTNWADTLDGPDPGMTHVTQAADAAHGMLAALRAEAQAAHAEHARNLATLLEERGRLLQGEVLVPPRPYTRDPAARESLQGAPLWQLVDFRADVGESDRASFEAALESAGILDAWVTPDGQLLAAGTHDVIVYGGRRIESARSLSLVLEPAIDPENAQAATVSAATVQRILDGIGAGAGVSDVWVEASGRWRNGVLEGSWSKPSAAFIGRGARDAARRRRLAELAEAVEQTEAAVATARRELDRVEDRQRALSDELQRRPAADELREAHAAATEARHHLERAEARVLQHEGIVTDLQQQAGSAQAARDEAATDLHLPADTASLDLTIQAIADYRAAVAGLWPSARAQLERVTAQRSNTHALDQAEQLAAVRSDAADRARRVALTERGRFEGLRASIGASVEQIRSQLASVVLAVSKLEEEERRLEALRIDCSLRLGRAQADRVRLDANLVDQGERRARAIEVLHRFALTGLLTAALPELELPSGDWAPDPVVRLARRVEQELEATDADDQAWERIRREIAARFKELQDALTAHTHYAALDPVDGWYVVSITFHGQQRSPHELAAHLSDEIAHRERLLSARERELLEEHLVTEVASHLQELIQEAAVQLDEMNDELTRRPTSTGMRLRFRWVPRAEGPPGLAEVRTRLLRQVHDAWSVEDRAAVSAFLKQQIDAARTANENGTWLEHLTHAFDYRRWHRFTIERLQDGHWRSASGPASSGERVLTVTLPLFAAASAHYRSAHASAPRLVMLDEVFAGVDDDSRSKSIGLLATFDLDFVMTSEREWGCYPTLPGLEIYQLARREGIDAVHVSPWTWDGRTRSHVDEPLAPRMSRVTLNGATTNGHVVDMTAG